MGFPNPENFDPDLMQIKLFEKLTFNLPEIKNRRAKRSQRMDRGSNLWGANSRNCFTGKSYGALVDWMDSTGQEVALWERMMDSPNEWVEDVLPLRVLMTHANR